jgi:hypothetical protein
MIYLKGFAIFCLCLTHLSLVIDTFVVLVVSSVPLSIGSWLILILSGLLWFLIIGTDILIIKKGWLYVFQRIVTKKEVKP